MHANQIDYVLELNGANGDGIFCRIKSYNTIPYRSLSCEIEGSGFKQDNVEVPAHWSDSAAKITASKYFRGHGEERERSVKQLAARVANGIAGYIAGKRRFVDDDSKTSFVNVLTWLYESQCFAFNSPVWFNLGAEENPQCSACFILKVEDNMESLMGWINDEGMVFRRGSGSGASLSRVRQRNAKMSGGGYASGPLSFANGANYTAGAIKSGGKTRRAAKMLVMDDRHPDVLDFIATKSMAENVVKALVSNGFSAEFNVDGNAYEIAPWQNANHSVRVSDDFMRAVELDGQWDLLDVTTKEVVKTIPSRDMMKDISTATWVCGDPGIQYDDKINAMNTCASDDKIYASNPCSEYMFLDNTSCNLASFNLVRYRNKVKHGSLADHVLLNRDCQFMYLCLDAIVDLAGYPTDAIDKTTRLYRTLGAGFANLGGLLMRSGVAYDSDKGRQTAAEVSSEITLSIYEMSAKAAMVWGPFHRYDHNSGDCVNVIREHARAVELYPSQVTKDHIGRWQDLVAGLAAGRLMLRNAQATVVAPTGTIGFMMDCDTTGIEPDIALVKFKKLVGGGFMVMSSDAVRDGLVSLGYSEQHQETILDSIKTHGHVEACQDLKPEHLPVFDCSIVSSGLAGVPGKRSISAEAHMLMMAASQPFISGAISKTINLPSTVTVDEITDVYIRAWKLGLKAVALFRDGCKMSQPMNTGKDKAGEFTAEHTTGLGRGDRETLANDREAMIHKFSIQGQTGYLTIGKFPDGRVGEIFVNMNDQGSTVSGFLDAWSKCVSLGLQYGMPVDVVIQKFQGSRFEPSGWTSNSDIKSCTSVVDYIAKFISRYVRGDEPSLDVYISKDEAAPRQETPACTLCGGETRRSGSCFCCQECGETTGCG